ncbi:predicted protein, partial [Postia placenta Mad-698-R]
MWKAEDPGVRGEYERLADVKKAEHAEQYPKEEKARRREEKRLEKERAREEAKRAKAQMSAYAPQYVPMVHMPYYHDAELPGFPSPPMSAASTPCSTPGSSLSELAPEHARPPSSAPTPAPAAQVSYAMPPPPEPVASGSTAGPAVQPPAAQFLQVPGQNSWSIPQATDASSSQPGPSNWTLDGQPQAEIDALDWLTLDIPSFGDDAPPFAGDANMHTADANANAGGDALALLAEGASIWRMDAFDAGAFLADPPGDFDVQFGQLTAFDAGMAGMGDVRLGMEMGMGMGQDAHAPGGDVQRQAEQFSELLSHFDFSQLPGGGSLFPSSAASGGGGAGLAWSASGPGGMQLSSQCMSTIGEFRHKLRLKVTQDPPPWLPLALDKPLHISQCGVGVVEDRVQQSITQGGCGARGEEEAFHDLTNVWVVALERPRPPGVRARSAVGLRRNVGGVVPAGHNDVVDDFKLFEEFHDRDWGLEDDVDQFVKSWKSLKGKPDAQLELINTRRSQAEEIQKYVLSPFICITLSALNPQFGTISAEALSQYSKTFEMSDAARDRVQAPHLRYDRDAGGSENEEKLRALSPNLVERWQAEAREELRRRALRWVECLKLLPYPEILGHKCLRVSAPTYRGHPYNQYCVYAIAAWEVGVNSRPWNGQDGENCVITLRTA